jgi:hypothetical protein
MMNTCVLTTVLVAIVVVQGEGRSRALHVGCATSGAACGRALQEALDAAPAGATITLEAGKVYEGSFIVKPREGASHERRLTITTHEWSDKGIGWDGLVTPDDKPRMAVLRGSPRSGATLSIPNGAGAGFVTVQGIAFAATPPAGQADLVRIGSSDGRSRGELAQHVSIRQVLLQGDRAFGQRRGIAANGADLEIAQVWCEEIFIAGQDSQCISAWNGGQRVRVHHAYLAAGAENLMIGGAPVTTAEMKPEDWLIEDVILHKPLRWQQDGRNRQVKNLLEFKHGRNLTARRVLAVNNWRAAQDGRGLLINYTTNGRCPQCGNLENVLVEDLVMLNTDEGISLQGHSWQPDSHAGGKLREITLRNLYVQLSKPGRAIQISNVLGAHALRIERSTFINHGPTWLSGSFGRAWRDRESLVDGGQMQGLVLLNNVFTANGEYGITAPERRHYGSGIGEFVNQSLVIAGNVIGDAPRDHVRNYNRHTEHGDSNVSASRDVLLKKLPSRSCGQWAAEKGADCTRLQAVFSWLQRLPEP